MNGSGLVFDSSTGFRLPNGEIRSLDAAWVKRDRLEALNPDSEEFLPRCPDFAIELRSASDQLAYPFTHPLLKVQAEFEQFDRALTERAA